jgi:hypothetical protein
MKNSIILLLFLILLLSYKTYSNEFTSDDLNNQALYFLKRNEYYNTFKKLINSAYISLQKKDYKEAGNLFILSSMVLNNIGDKSSYTLWKLAINNYIKVNTSWEIEKNFLSARTDYIGEIFKTLDGNYFIGPDLDLKKDVLDDEEIKLLDNILKNRIDYVQKSIDEDKKTEITSQKNNENNLLKKEEKENIAYQNFKNLSEESIYIVKNAWKYFQNNYNPQTGFFNASLGYPYLTMWDIASGIAALISSNKLGIIDDKTFSRYIEKQLNSLSKMKLYKNELPNREYNVSNLEMSVSGKNSSTGSGWSSIDIGRFLIWMKILSNEYPQYKNIVENIVKKYNFSRLIKDDKMFGVYFDGKKEKLRQEGRLGYEQYAAKGYKLWNINLIKALDYEPSKKIKIEGVEIIVDTRNFFFLNSEPFILSKIELDFIDDNFEDITKKIYKIQKIRWEKYKKLTAFSEDAIDKKPWFLYNSIYHENIYWSAFSPNGKEYKNLRTLSTKACFGFDAIFNDNYSNLLKNSVLNNVSKNNGYYAGIYENDNTINKSLNINTNAIILESLYYKHFKKSFIAQ